MYDSNSFIRFEMFSFKSCMEPYQKEDHNLRIFLEQLVQF